MNGSSRLLYDIYLDSPHWKALAKLSREQAGYRCERCGKKPSDGVLHVHHLSYENLGYEPPEDLMVLCEKCHKDIHGRHGLEWQPLRDSWD